MVGENELEDGFQSESKLLKGLQMERKPNPVVKSPTLSDAKRILGAFGCGEIF